MTICYKTFFKTFKTLNIANPSPYLFDPLAQYFEINTYISKWKMTNFIKHKTRGRRDWIRGLKLYPLLFDCNGICTKRL